MKKRENSQNLAKNLTFLVNSAKTAIAMVIGASIVTYSKRHNSA